MDLLTQNDHTEFLGVAILAAIVCFLVFMLLAFLLRKRVNLFPYEMQEQLFTPAERHFLQALDQAVGQQLRVFGKVRVADVVKVSSMRDRAQWQRAFNKISSKHFDYVLCAPGDLAVLCAVELDDATHNQRRRIERDRFLEGVCEAAGLPLLRVPTSRHYEVRDLQAEIRAALQG